MAAVLDPEVVEEPPAIAGADLFGDLVPSSTSIPQGLFDDLTPDRESRLASARQKIEEGQATSAAAMRKDAVLAVAQYPAAALDFFGAINRAGGVIGGFARDVMAGRVLPSTSNPIITPQGIDLPDLEATGAAFRGEPPPDQGLTPVQEGLADAAASTPTVAAGMALTAGGVPAPLAFGTVMGGTTLEATQDPQAAIKAGAVGALIPGVAGEARRFAGQVLGEAVKRGIVGAESTTAHKVVEAVASQAATQAFVETSKLPEYLEMSPEQRADALQRSLAGNLAFGLLEIPGFRKSVPSETQRVMRQQAIEQAAVKVEQAGAPATAEALRRTAVDTPPSIDTLPKPPAAEPEILKSAETKLAEFLNDTIDATEQQRRQQVAITVIPGIGPGAPKPADVVLGGADLKSVSPTVEGRWQAAVAERPGILARLQDAAVNAWHSITREYSELNPRQFPREIDILRRLRASRDASARRTADVLRGITVDLGPKQYDVFNRVVALEDLAKDVEGGKYASGNDLPFGYADAAELQADVQKFRTMAEATPEIKGALERRQQFMDGLRDTLVERGFLPETVRNDPRYFHHQVLLFLSEKHAPSNPKSFREWFSGWQKARKGSSLDYNRQYVESEAEVIQDAFAKMQMQDLQGEMRAASDLTAELKRLHGPDWEQHIPKGHVRWQPKRGTVFYPAKTVAEKALDEYFNGIRDLLPADFRDALVMGGRRQEWIIPKELVGVLDDLGGRKDTWIDKLASAGIAGWKRYILLNPFRALKYNVNNTSGDLDFVFAAQPKIFGEFKGAAGDMHALHVKGAAAAGDVKDAMELGVIGSGWKASEMPDIAQGEYFSWLTGEKPGLIQRYWNFVGKWTNAREDVGRLAAYRFALKQWEAGKPFYGASVPEDVSALPNNKERAAKVSRELLIDYGRSTEFGDFMRKKAIPFFKWMEGNFARYIQLVRNVPYQEGRAGARLATVAGKRTAVKAGGLAARAAFAYAAVNLWNNTFFPDEEEELGDSGRHQLHLILGRDDEGNIQTIRFQGALSDLLGWVAMEDLPADVREVVGGKASVGDKLEEAGEAAVSRVVNASSPFYKTGAEAMAGRSFYPNALHPRPIRDPMEHIAGLFSLKNVYQWLAGKPHRPMRQEIASLIAYSTDPGEAAYNMTRSLAIEWLEDKGEDASAVIPGKKANALYYYKQALRYKDRETAQKFLNQYIELGGTPQGLQQSIRAAEPLATLGWRRFEFMRSLSPAERATVERAEKWYQRVYRSNQ